MGRFVISGFAVLAALVGVLAMAAAGGAGTGDSPTVAISVPNEPIKPGEAVNVSGRVISPVPGGEANVPLVIYENPWPYDNERRIATLETTANGNFKLRVRPKYNTRYRAVFEADPENTSTYPAVWVLPKKASTDVDFVDDRTIRAKMKLEVASQLPYNFTGNKLYFYFHRKGTKNWVPKATARLHGRGGKVTAKARFDIPDRGEYRFFVTWCFDPTRPDIGVGKPQKARCPRRPFPFTG